MRGRLLTVRSLSLKLSPFSFKIGHLSLSSAPGRVHTKTAKPSHDEGLGAHTSKLVRVLLLLARSNTQHPSLYPVAFEISKLLDCGLDKESLAILVSLCENGVSPEALATVMQELRREATTLRN